MPNGKICYVEIPATSVEVSAAFYEKVFAWEIRTRGDGERAFNDTTGQVSGTWVLGREPNSTPGMITYVMVDDIQATLDRIASAGGRVATPRTSLDHGDAFATFLDPAGNLMGLYQEPRS